MSDGLPRLPLAVQVAELLHEHANVSVYLCEDPTTSERVVVKQVWPCEAETPASIVVHSDLQRELIAAQRLVQASASRLEPHPHVVRYLHTQPSLSGSPAFLTMEYYPNGDLFSLLLQQPGSYILERQALTLFQQIVSGLHCLHSLGIAHRDISLENILLDAQGNAKICDFGLSISTTRPCCDQVGKLLYMAPEVVSGQVYDPVAANVWSLGTLLFILLTGSPLFTVADPMDPAWRALQRVGVAGILAQWKVDAQVSPGTMDVLPSLLQVDPQQRPKTLEVVVEAARELVASASSYP